MQNKIEGNGEKILEYNKGNYEKYISKNPLKRKMVEKFNSKLISIIGKIAEELKLQNGGG